MADSKPNPESKTRCYHCAGPLFKDMETSHWTVAPLIREFFHDWVCCRGYNECILWIQPCDAKSSGVGKRTYVATFLHWCPPVIVFSSACAGLACGAVPALAQLASSSYHAVVSSPSVTPSQDANKQKGQRFFSLVSATVLASVNCWILLFVRLGYVAF